MDMVFYPVQPNLIDGFDNSRSDSALLVNIGEVLGTAMRNSCTSSLMHLEELFCKICQMLLAKSKSWMLRLSECRTTSSRSNLSKVRSIYLDL